MSNKGVREILEMIYGRECMFFKAQIPERLKGTKIKGYKQYIEEQHFKSKKINKLERTLTLHHLIHQSEGGETTLENGAVINELAHRYIHSLPREQEEIINNMLREYKNSITLRGGILISDERIIQLENPIQLEFDEDSIVLELHDMSVEMQKKRFNRAKEKQEIERQIEEDLLDYFKGG